MVWAGISLRARTELNIVENGSMNAERYISDILKDYVMPFAPYIGDQFILMYYNARPHVAQKV